MIKKIFFAVFLLCCTICGEKLFAQSRGLYSKIDGKDVFKRNSLYVDVFSIFFSGYGFGYEREIARHNFLCFQGTYYNKSGYASLRPTDMKHINGYALGLFHEYDYFDNKDKGYKLYFAYGGKYSFFNMEKVSGDYSSFDKIAFEFNFGYKVGFASIFYLDLSLGLGQSWIMNKQAFNLSSEVDEKIKMFDYAYSGQLFLVNIKFGVVF